MIIDSKDIMAVNNLVVSSGAPIMSARACTSIVSHPGQKYWLAHEKHNKSTSLIMAPLNKDIDKIGRPPM